MPARRIFKNSSSLREQGFIHLPVLIVLLVIVLAFVLLSSNNFSSLLSNIKSSPGTVSANPSGELITNGSFELDTDGDRVPDGWKWTPRKPGRNEGRVCDTAYSGSCTLRIDGKQKNETSVSQTITVIG